MNADGTDVRRLTESPTDDGWPAWSPDGRQIVFSSTRDDCAYSQAENCLTTGDIGPWHTLYVMNTDGTDQHLKGAKIPIHHAAASYSWMRPSRRSRRLSFIADAAPARTGWALSRGLEVESPMGPAAVVVAGVRAQDSLEVPSTAHKRPVQALRSDRSDPSLGEGVGSRSPVGVRTTSTPSVRNTSSNSPENMR